MTTTPCILCGSIEFEKVYTDNEITLVCCMQCKLVRQLDYAGALARLNGEFDSVANYYKKRGENEGQVSFKQRKIEVTRDIREEIKHRVGSGGKALDVGCGHGEFLVSLKNIGLDVMGVEPDQSSAHFVQQLGIRTVHSIYKRTLFPPGSFDVISFIQVMEHLEDPLQVLRTAYLHLKPGGLLVIDVPSFNNPRILTYRLFRWKRLVSRDFIPSHCYYYTRETLVKLVQKAGFEVIRADTGRYTLKTGMNNIVMRIIDRSANWLGVGGISLYAKKKELEG